ncbi:hypothetical protein HMPREF9622_01392 [Cutibacterium modestum HL037PA3]|nr:hypothetical protein HMPREF9621_01006 [Cutibacterium modestum HL037PA2]EFT15617.1 hypothetical protein HMPREF9622_01392 [Cutibacterium modestum HL037PA3]
MPSTRRSWPSTCCGRWTKPESRQYEPCDGMDHPDELSSF